jgi:hypothetical protein
LGLIFGPVLVSFIHAARPETVRQKLIPYHQRCYRDNDGVRGYGARGHGSSVTISLHSTQQAGLDSKTAGTIIRARLEILITTHEHDL